MTSAGILYRGRPIIRKSSTTKESQSQLCNYTGHVCQLNQLDGYQFCIRHILQDINAPYRQCSFVNSKNGKRCPNAAPKIENKESYCSDHTKKILLARQRALRKHKPAETIDSLLDELSHYGSKTAAIENVPAVRRRSESTKDKKSPQSISKVLDYASETESDSEPILIEQTWKVEADSEAESVDSETEDPLRHAGVYTAEEVSLITRDKMIRLQSLYIQELKRLNHVLRERRRAYLHGAKQEKETLGSIHATPRTTPEEERQYQKLRALLRYHTKRGPELILHKKALDLRMTGGSSSKQTSCTFISDEHKCTNPSLPYTKYCNKHILHDNKQVLFKKCSSSLGGPCQNPVVTPVDGETCLLHLTPGPLPVVQVETAKSQEVNDHPAEGMFAKGGDNQTEIPDDLMDTDQAEQQIQATALALLESLSSNNAFDLLPLPPVPQEDLLAVTQNSPEHEGDK